jgi:hypothetical protein
VSGRYHDGKHVIIKGDTCLEIKDGNKVKGYCVQCGRSMLRRASETVAALEASISPKS